MRPCAGRWWLPTWLPVDAGCQDRAFQADQSITPGQRRLQLGRSGLAVAVRSAGAVWCCLPGPHPGRVVALLLALPKVTGKVGELGACAVRFRRVLGAPAGHSAVMGQVQ